jgi:uncharacterized membrane protein YkvA (DUF1232 family)
MGSADMWPDIAAGVALGLVLMWVLLVVALLLLKPKGNLLKESLRILPDLLRLLGRLVKDPSLPRGVRIRLGLLMAYLAIPVDLIPDFVPVLGYADDAIVVVAVLRSVVRVAGIVPLQAQWPGSPDGFQAMCSLVGLKALVDPAAHTDQGQQEKSGRLGR